MNDDTCRAYDVDGNVSTATTDYNGTQTVADYIGAPYCVAVSSCTAALMLAVVVGGVVLRAAGRWRVWHPEHRAVSDETGDQGGDEVGPLEPVGHERQERRQPGDDPSEDGFGLLREGRRERIAGQRSSPSA